MITIEIQHGSIERWLDQHQGETGETPSQFVRRMVIGQMVPDAPWATGPLSDHPFKVPSGKTA